MAVACASLGFGGDAASRHELVLVDNGSSDGTLTVCRDIASGSGRVLVVSEPERGYVPARAAGIRAAANLPSIRTADPRRVVIVQADADTHYSPGYVDEMEAAAGPGRLAAATVATDRTFEDAHPVLAAVAALDAAVLTRPPPRQLDVVVDDKAVAFTLEDYVHWGGHRREYRSDGVELLAESTRLFLAGVMRGAVAVDVADAAVWHSQRRLDQDAAQHLASAGYPYGPVRVAGDARVTLGELDQRFATDDRALIERILRVRRLHLIALFRVLPSLVAELVGGGSQDSEVEAATQSMPRRTTAEVADHPGLLIADVLDLVAFGDAGPLGNLT